MLEEEAYKESVREPKSEEEILDDVAMRATYPKLDKGLRAFARELVTDLRKGNLPYKEIRRRMDQAKLGDMFQILTLQTTEEFLKDCEVIQEVTEVYLIGTDGRLIGNTPIERYIRKRPREDEFVEYEEHRDPDKGTLTIIHRDIVYELGKLDSNFVDVDTGLSIPIFDIKTVIRDFIASGSINGWMTDKLITAKKEVVSSGGAKGWFR